jgi:hypothetical protein
MPAIRHSHGPRGMGGTAIAFRPTRYASGEHHPGIEPERQFPPTRRRRLIRLTFAGQMFAGWML